MIETLLVDDDRGFLDLGKTYLEKQNKELEVKPINSSNQAGELIEENNYDCVVSDYQMPDLDGLELLKKVREDLNSNVPFIIFTGKGREEVAMEALNLGADRYLQKGGDPKSQFGVLAQAIDQEVRHAETGKMLRESEQKYKRPFETAQDGILILDAKNGEIKSANPYIEELLGYKRERFIGKKLWEIGTFRDVAETKKRFKKLVNEGNIRYEDLPLETKDGKEVSVEFVSNTYEAGGKKLVQCNIREISERKEAERKYKKIANQSHDAIYIYQQNIFLFVNDRVSEITGYSKQELYNMEIWKLIHPDDRSRVKRIAKKRSENKKAPSTYEARILTKDGETRFCEFAVSKINYKGQYAVIGSVRDITERKKVGEREQFLHSLLRHDLQNKNQVIEGYLELLKEEIDDSNLKFVNKALKACKEGQDIIEKVRTLKKIKKTKKEEVKLDPIIERVVKENHDEANERGLEIEKNFPTTKFQVNAGPLLEEIFKNLIENAIRHSGGSLVRVSAGEEDDKVICSVEDNGKGIPDELKQKVFEKGFKYGETGETGLGLYLVKEIIEKYDGKIEAKDSDLGGARFDVYLQET